MDKLDKTLDGYNNSANTKSDNGNEQSLIARAFPAQRSTNMLQQVKVILNDIYRHPCAVHFKNPVEAVPLGILDKYDAGRHPINLTAILSRLMNNHYQKAQEAIDDFDLLIRNSMKSNSPGSQMYVAGKELKVAFCKRVAGLDLRQEVEVLDAEPMEPIIKKLKLNIMEVMPEPLLLSSMPNISYDHLDCLIEKSHCEHLIESMMKRNNAHFTWPFNSADHWRVYSRNPDYDHDKETKLDWQILRKIVKSEQFSGMDAFADTVRIMFANALKCFPTEVLLRESVTQTSVLFEDRLVKYRAQVTEAKDRARKVVVKKVELLQSTDNMAEKPNAAMDDN